MNKLFTKLAWKYRRMKNRQHLRIPAGELGKRLGRTIPETTVESLIIPVVGLDYIGEGMLAASFAERFYPALKEIVLVTDCPESAFGPLPLKAVIKRLNVDVLMPAEHAYTAIFRSRLIKLMAPLQANYERVLMTDSDLLLLQPLTIPFTDQCLMGSFRRGKMISKVHQSGVTAVPAELRGTYRPYIWDHLNGAFLAGTRATWQKLSPAWLAAFISIWSKLPDNQPPTDQLPLCCVLDHLNIATVDLGDWVNWPVSKKIGGKPSRIPREVIGAHGGFPLAEWQRYLENPEASLNFIDPDQTRKIRYLTDQQKVGT